MRIASASLFRHAIILAGLIIVADQFTKWLIMVEVMNPPRVIPVIPIGNMGINLCVRLHIKTRRHFIATEAIKRLLRKNFPRQADAGPEILPVRRVRHVVEADHRRVGRVARPQGDGPA